MDTEEAYQRVKKERAKKGLSATQITKPVISGKAARDLFTTFRHREETQAKAHSSSLSKVIR